MKAFLVINLLEEYSDCGPCLVEVKIKVLILGECIVSDFENVDFMVTFKVDNARLIFIEELLCHRVARFPGDLQHRAEEGREIRSARNGCWTARDLAKGTYQAVARA